MYIYQGIEAIRHLMKVASGLDSMVLGEPTANKRKCSNCKKM